MSKFVRIFISVGFSTYVILLSLYIYKTQVMWLSVAWTCVLPLIIYHIYNLIKED